MARLTYGNGNCSVDGNCRAIQIEYRGAIRMMDKTPNNFVFHLNSHRIIIYPLGQGLLTDLFDYKGEFKIISAKAVDTNAEFLPLTIDAQTDYTELSSTNPEDSTISIEDLDSTYTVGERIGRTVLLLSKKDNQTMANNFLNNSNKILSGSVTASMQKTSQTASISTGTSY
tara:strand:- start:1222 stop:1734 length:513 start_codon:yes stop_codon:yes gene_type:complete